MELEREVTTDDVFNLILEEKALESKDQVLNVYVFGSRLYGYAKKETSDWDFIVVVDCEYFAGPKLIERGKLNLNLYHKNYIQFLLDENVVWFVMILWIPTQFAWLVKQQFSWKLRKNALKKMINLDVQHNFTKAKRLWKNPSTQLIAKKNLLHAKRWLEYGRQIAEHGKIIDFVSEERLQCQNV